MVTHEDLKAARLRLGESQAYIARRLGVHQTTVHIWETEGLPNYGPTRTAVEILVGQLNREADERAR